MRLSVAIGAALVLAVTSAGTAWATQTVTPVRDAIGTTFAPNGVNSWAVTRGAGQTLVVYARYSSSNINESGLGLQLQYDETKFTGITIDQVMNKCLVASPQMQNVSPGNSKAMFGWADISIRRSAGTPNGVVGWTGTADPAAPTQSGSLTDGCLDVTTFGAPGPQTTSAVGLPTNLFRFTATLAGGFTSGTSTITFAGTSASSAVCVPGPGAPCFTNQTLVVTGSAAPPLVLQTVVSRKTHGAAGTFDLGLGLVPTNPTTEPRSTGAGGSHSIVFTFDQPVTSGSAGISEGSAVAGVPTFSGNSMTVPLSGVTNQQYVTIVVSNVASSGGSTGSGTVRIGFLLGDVNQSRVVSVADLGLVNAQLAQPVTAANFLKDVNVSGAISVADKGITNANLTKALPAP
jgi:hypothetical protein